jgi:hypothetical protein
MDTNLQQNQANRPSIYPRKLLHKFNVIFLLKIKISHWRIGHPDMEDSCDYTEQAIADSRQGWSPAQVLGRGLTTPHCKKSV